MSDTLSQAEINALMNGGATAEPEKTAETKEEPASSETSQPKEAAPTSEADALDEQAKSDLIGEVGNISMSQAATTLSSILNHRVSITTPRVTRVRFKDLIDGIKAPKVATTVEFKEGLTGVNLMLLEVRDANVIANLMMGGDGTPENEEFTELELSAVAEAMNQMIGSAATSMATMISTKVDILPPKVNLWNEPGNIKYDFIVDDEVIYKISFSLNVDGLIQSEIMQIFTDQMVNDIAQAMLADKATVVDNRETAASQSEESKSQAPAPSQAPSQASSSQPAPAPKPQPKPKHQEPVEVQSPEFQNFEPTQPAAESNDNLDLIMDIPLNLSVVLGRSKKTVRDILSFNTGSVIELDKLTDEPLEILLNGKLIATGEVVVINENFGVRITDILSPQQRLDYMR
ncbi:flagellar motor switch phosphatase FliY [Lactobacillus agilis]|uniref:Flagellar motor switch phosphatase FliY n=1 Tax=Ligilactobacillus agilis TaxID=1601 RepID=A0A848CCA5_9LACO|nr:flagellar motor switch phosphatase FliY [Ligilactobacillus agilis]MCI5761197.1 flagellar motor switch phosphatase FliY [Ligilactobacillus agilis]MCL8205562.1 flagellar motor switch phosphatase FliY [Ligilactobacillus agilis]NME42026.1 flagellar motor switch phosphatase FliY [Ligilactobacillus agilis]